jgi:carboxyl-terminal processing protease
VSTRGLLSSPLAAIGGRAFVALAGATLAACAGQEPASSGADGKLFARGLVEVSELYIEPVSSKRLALAGMARLSRLDKGFVVSDGFGSGLSPALTVSYDGRDVGFFAIPAENDSRQWGALVTRIIATAKQVSPQLAALPQETIDTAVFSGMAASLDRFSHYSAPEVARDQRAQRDGFGGIGITLDSVDKAFRVTAVAPQSPAERAGIRPEDQIVAVDGVATAGCPHQEVMDQLRGPIGSPIAVRVLHPGSTQARDLRLSRSYVVLPTVTMSRDGDIAVFRITSFNHSTTQRIAKGLDEAERQAGGKLAGVVLDLRGNPGGLLDQAVSLTNLFVHDGPIVATVGRHPASHQFFSANGGSIVPKLPVAVLINGGSASASEIVAAALQDAGRAVVIGSASYGKGTVQTVLRLPNDGELVVTWAGLVAPAGYLLQQHGVVPTVCTGDLGDDASGLDAALSRAVAPGAGPTAGPRASLDERGWAELRQSCPPRHGSPAIDLKVAERLLADPKIYGDAVNVLARNARLAQGSAAPQGALTDGSRELSSGIR